MTKSRLDQERLENSRRMADEARQTAVAAHLLEFSVRHKYSYNFNWLGRPIIQYPQDIVAMQEIIWAVKPDLILETGIAHGGSIVFYASMLELLGKGIVVGVDIDIRSHNHSAIVCHPMAKRIQMIEGSSVDPKIVEKVRGIAQNFTTVLVCLDSNHTHAHVAAELAAYAELVSIGSYIVVFDTMIECLPDEVYSDRPWGKGNNPSTAVKAFLEKDVRFVIDEEYDQKLLISVAPGGYLRRVK